MVLAAAAVGSDHFVGTVSVPASLMSLFVRKMADFRLVGR